MKRLVLLLVGLALLVLQACAGWPASRATPSASTRDPEASNLGASNLAESPSVEQTGLPGDGTPAPTLPFPLGGLPGSTGTPALVRLRIWVPPQFDPNAETPAGAILKERLEEFMQLNPGIQVQVRVKDISGVGGLLDSLSTTSAAAPLAMPELVALPRELLEAAALKGLLHPINDLTEILTQPDWYPYARQLAYLQDSAFGLPFAGDALALVYRPEALEVPPADLAKALEVRTPLVFPAADPLALFTIAMYQAGGGAIRDGEGRPFLDVARLAAILDFYKRAEESGAMPYWLTQFQNDDQVWEAFQEKRFNLVVTWSSRYLAKDGDIVLPGSALPTVAPGTAAPGEPPPDELVMAPLPTPDGAPFTLATGWVWALATSNRDNRLVSLQLAEFLCEPRFLARWTEAMGYLPPRADALQAWSDSSLQLLLSQLARSAMLYPSTDISTPLGASLQEAVVQVLKKQNDPENAAQAAAEGLLGP